MKKEIFLILFLLNISLVFAKDPDEKKIKFINYPGFYYTYESGIASRISIQDVAMFRVANKHLFSAALRIHLNQQAGFGSFYLAAEEVRIPLSWLYFGAELAHHEFPDYKIGENQIAVLAVFLPFKKIKVGIGYTYRSVNIQDKDLHSFFDWNNEMDEGYIIFQFRWLIYESNRWNLAYKMGTYDFMRIQSKDHVFIEFEQQFKIKENISFQFNVSTAIKGISGMILAVNEFQLETGVIITF